MSKKVINAKKRVKNSLEKRSKHYSQILEKRLSDYRQNESSVNNVEIYDKAFFINEDLNNLKQQLSKFEKVSENLEE